MGANVRADVLGWLDSLHPIYSANKDAWEREERRLFGGDLVLEELENWNAESEEHYAQRQAEASYINFPKIHTSTLIGHLRRSAPIPGRGYNFKEMGEIRDRADIDQPNLAEMTWYNIDGVGQDGSQWPAWWDSVHERAMATGHRWIFVEKPPAPKDRKATRVDVLKGFRAYAVEFSPLDVTYWHYVRGELQVAIVRIPVGQMEVRNGTLLEPNSTTDVASDSLSPGNLPGLGYYLMVRKGFRGLGSDYEQGGWWIYNANREEVSKGRWESTNGQIPLFPLFGEVSKGTKDHPAMSSSLTMELGQVSIGLMNRISDRDYDASDAAKSVKYILGASKESFNMTVDFHNSGQIVVPVMASMDDSGKPVIPQIYDSSAGAVPAEVFKIIIEGKISEAYEIMSRQVSATSGPNSSEKAKQAGFAERKSPLLSRLAANREQAENTFLYFCALRNGIKNPTAYAQWPRDFDLRPLIADITEILTLEKLAGLKSVSFDKMALRKAAEDRGLFDNRAQADTAEAEWAQPPVVGTPGLSGQEQSMLGGTATTNVPMSATSASNAPATGGSTAPAGASAPNAGGAPSASGSAPAPASGAPAPSPPADAQSKAIADLTARVAALEEMIKRLLEALANR